MPRDIPVANLYPITWNPVNLLGRLAAIPGLASARRIGVDALTPLMEMLLTSTFPKAELADGQRELRGHRLGRKPLTGARRPPRRPARRLSLDMALALLRPAARESLRA